MHVGNVVEEDLVKGDVRLTMGGEPTFVSIDDMESAQWNSTADGPLKRKLAYDLAIRLKNRFAHGGFIQASGILESLFRVGNMRYTGEKTAYLFGKTRSIWLERLTINIRPKMWKGL
jgi:uncharacterized protein (DUF2126 family)